MWQFILIGDVLIMGFMIALVVWICMRDNARAQEEHMRIPLEDEADE